MKFDPGKITTRLYIFDGKRIQERNDRRQREMTEYNVTVNDNQDNDEMLNIEQEYVSDLIDEQLNLGNSAILMKTNEIQNKSIINRFIPKRR